MTRQIEAIDDLLARGADIDARRMDGARPIHLTNGDYGYRGWRDVPRDWPVSPAQVLAQLEAKGARIDINTAAHTGDLARVRALLDADPSLVRQGGHAGYYLGAGTPLKNAAAGGHMDIVRLLLERGADPNEPEEHIAPKGHALYAAVYNGHYEIAKLLLERGAFPNPPVESSADALWIAKGNKDERMVALLESFGAKPEPGRPAADNGANHPNWLMIRPLHHAAREGDLPQAMALLARGADLHARDEHIRSTPLAWAAKFGRAAMVKLLLDYGAKTELPDDPPWATPLAWARRRGHKDVERVLLRAGA